MPSSAMIAIVFLAFLRVVAPLKVIAGDTIDFQCVTEKRDNVEYLPNFERKNNDDTWTTLFVGSNPRPDTNLSKWKVNVDEKSVFHYRLLNADLEDGGHYRCENVNTNHHPLNVFSPILDCGGGRGRGDSAANIFVDDVQSFRPVCRVQTSGPLSLEEEEEDVVSSPALKWVVGGEERVGSKTRSNSSHVEAVLTKQLSEEHHGKVISCVLDAGISSEKEDRPNCVLGPLNISFDVRVKSSRDNHRDNCHYYDLILTGNPSPILQFVTIEDSTGAVQSGISYADAADNADAADAGKTPERRGIAAEPEVSPQQQQQPTSGDVAVHLRACDLESSVIAAVLYEGVEVTTLTFTTSGSASGSDDGKPILVDATAAETAGPVGAIVAAIVVILVISGIVAGVLYYVVKRKEATKKVDEDVESGEGNGGVGGEVAGVEEVKEGVEEKVEEKVVEKKESRDDEKSSSKNEEDAAEIIVDSDADAAALKAKLSEVEESESDAVLNAKLSALEDVEGVKMIDDSLNEGKEEESSLEDKDKVEV